MLSKNLLLLSLLSVFTTSYGAEAEKTGSIIVKTEFLNKEGRALTVIPFLGVMYPFSSFTNKDLRKKVQASFASTWNLVKFEFQGSEMPEDDERENLLVKDTQHSYNDRYSYCAYFEKK